MSLPKFRRQLDRMAENALLQTKTTRDIARKAGIEPGTSAGEGPPDIHGSFTLSDADNPLGYTESIEASASRFLPENLPQMDRFADYANATQARLVLKVTQAGVSGSRIGITADGATFVGGLFVALDSTGFKESLWTSISKTQEGIVTHWMVENPNLLAGSFGIGLGQLQVR